MCSNASEQLQEVQRKSKVTCGYSESDDAYVKPSYCVEITICVERGLFCLVSIPCSFYDTVKCVLKVFDHSWSKWATTAENCIRKGICDADLWTGSRALVYFLKWYINKCRQYIRTHAYLISQVMRFQMLEGIIDSKSVQIPLNK